MSVASFCAAMAPYAKQAAAATGLRCELFLTQWGLESAWGTSAAAVNDHNFAGLHHSAGSGCTCCAGDGITTICPTAGDFTLLYIAILRQSYGALLGTRGQSLNAQFVALGNSTWDAGHYEGGCGTPGCALISLYNQNATEISSVCGTSSPPPPPCNPACIAPAVCVSGVCRVPVPIPVASSGGTLLLFAGLLAAGAAWEYRERISAIFGSSNAAGGGGFGARPVGVVTRAAPREESTGGGGFSEARVVAVSRRSPPRAGSAGGRAVPAVRRRPR